MYEFFTDIGEDPTPGAKATKKTKISNAFKKIGDELLFHFDYGDNWRFNIRLLRIEAAQKGILPKIVEKFGDDLEQYPSL